MIFCVLKKGSGAEEGGEKNFTHRAKNHVVVRVFIIFFGENWNVYKIRGAKKCNCHLFCRQNAIPGLCIQTKDCILEAKNFLGELCINKMVLADDDLYFFS